MTLRHSAQLLCAGIIAWALIAGGTTLAGTDPAAPLGSNIVQPRDFTDEFPFVNLMKSGRDWIPGNATGCFDCRTPGGNAVCLSPNACPVTINRDADGYVTSLLPNQVVRSVVHAGSNPGRLAAGNYTLRFDGAGSVQFGGANVVSQGAGEVVFNISSSTSTNIFFTLTAITSGNHLRNIRILPPGGVCSNDDRRFCDGATACANGGTCRLFTTAGVAEAQLFHPRFLKNYEPFRLLRYLDWMGVNNNEVPTAVNLGDYPVESSAFWNTVPVTVLAALGNRLRSDIWISVPHLASDALVDDFATKLRDQFTADRKIYIEYSNENWNGIYPQRFEIPRQFCPGYADLISGCLNDGVPVNSIACEFDSNFSLGAASAPCFQALVRGWGDRSVQIFDRFDAIFGSSARQRLVRVIASQAANPDLGRQVLSRTVTGQAFTVASKTDVYASAPYFGTEYCTSGGVNPDTSPAVYASTTAFLDHLETSGLATARGFMQNSKAMLTTNFPGSGIRHVSYEGGQHLAGIGSFTFDATCNTRFDEANRSPRMTTIYRTYLSDWKANGDEFNHYYGNGRYSVFGRWGALEFQDQVVSTAPKYVALTGHSAANPCHWSNCTQTVILPNLVFSNGFE